jgi:hypothetical protein
MITSLAAVASLADCRRETSRVFFISVVGFKIGVVRGQAVWPSKVPVLGIFFSCCGVIFA